MCHPCDCVGTTDLPDPESWYEALCSMPKLKTFSVEVAHREKELKEIHLAAIGVGKRLLEEKRIEAFYLLSPKQIGDCMRFVYVKQHFGELINAGSHPAFYDRTDPKKLAKREFIAMKIPYETYKRREVLWSPGLLAVKGGDPKMREVLKIVRKSDIDIKSLGSRKTPPKTPLFL